MRGSSTGQPIRKGRPSWRKAGPVWLIDIDLFNRGATSALRESEKEIPLSVAGLILAALPSTTPLGFAD